MEITYYGANCVKIANKKVGVVIDDTMVSNGKKSIVTDKDIVLVTNKDLPVKKGGYFYINSPGEYEVSEVSVKGIAMPLHIDENKLGIVYSVHLDGFSIAIIGHSVGKLSEDQLEALGIVDVLIIPVGGNGYTIDAVAAAKLTKDISPKIVIPTHYDDSLIKYEVDQAPVDIFAKIFGVTEIEKQPALKVKDSNLPEKTQLVILETK